MNDLISRKALLAEYDRVHIGEPGKARKLIEDAPAVTDNNVGDKLTPTEPLTNADRIRAMSDGELYKFCLSLTDEGWPFACENRPECDPVPPQPHLCNDCFMKWLQQPAGEA